MNLDEPGAAVSALRRAVQMTPHDEAAAYCLAEAAVSAGQKPIALAAINHWVQLRNGLGAPPVPLEGAPPAHDIETLLQVGLYSLLVLKYRSFRRFFFFFSLDVTLPSVFPVERQA